MKQRIDAIRWAAGEIEKQAGVMLNSRSAFPGREAVEEILQAAYMAEYYCNQWAKANSAEEGKPKHGKQAERILKHIEKAGPDGLSKYELGQKIRNVPNAIYKAAIGQLVADGSIQELEVKTGRRPRTVYRVAPVAGS
jgi:hypothetical protein